MILKNLEANKNTVVTEYDIDFHIINSHSELKLESVTLCDAIIFRSDKVSFVKTEIQRIRRSDNPVLYLKPIFVSSKRVFLRLNKDADGYLGDEELGGLEDQVNLIRNRAAEIAEFAFPKHATFHQKNFLKLCQYLYTRETKLDANRSRQAHMGYRYGFVNYLVPDLELNQFLDVVNDMKKIGFINTTLAERVNLCKKCSSSYLHFVETCHKCKSVDIQTESLIHHFRCAYIGPETDFQQEDVLVCPKCDKVLRHIGVDYDKPSEIINCGSCNHQSQQSAILANCVDCGKENDLANLHSKEMYNISLTEQGKNLALNPISLFSDYKSDEDERLDLEIDESTFDLLARQEAKKKQANNLASYTLEIKFSDLVIDTLVTSEVKIFTLEFKKILVNYLEEIDLFATISPVQYKFLMVSKSEAYAEDMAETLRYNINKVLNDNFNDPDHQLVVTTVKLS